MPLVAILAMVGLGWAVTALALALILARGVRIADLRRPRPRYRRTPSPFDRWAA